MIVIDLEKWIINFLFGKTIKKFREWKIKKYKVKKVKNEAKNSIEKLYKMNFKLSIKDKNGIISSDTIFNIDIPANGYFFAKKKLERFVISNIDIDIVDFNVIEEEFDETVN